MTKDEIEKQLEAQIAASRLQRGGPSRRAGRQNDDDASRKGVREQVLLRDIVRNSGRTKRMDAVIRQHAEDLFEVPLDSNAVAAAIRMHRRR